MNSNIFDLWFIMVGTFRPMISWSNRSALRVVQHGSWVRRPGLAMISRLNDKPFFLCRNDQPNRVSVAGFYLKNPPGRCHPLIKYQKTSCTTGDVHMRAVPPVVQDFVVLCIQQLICILNWSIGLCSCWSSCAFGHLFFTRWRVLHLGR